VEDEGGKSGGDGKIAGLETGDSIISGDFILI
jgi:hypothetical protein